MIYKMKKIIKFIGYFLIIWIVIFIILYPIFENIYLKGYLKGKDECNCFINFSNEWDNEYPTGKKPYINLTLILS